MMVPEKLTQLKSKIKDVVVINKEKLTITDFQTTDPEVVGYFEKIKPELRQDRLVSTLRTGVIALKDAQIGERVDYVEKEFQKLNHKYTNTLGLTADVAGGRLA